MGHNCSHQLKISLSVKKKKGEIERIYSDPKNGKKKASKEKEILPIGDLGSKGTKCSHGKKLKNAPNDKVEENTSKLSRSDYLEDISCQHPLRVLLLTPVINYLPNSQRSLFSLIRLSVH